MSSETHDLRIVVDASQGKRELQSFNQTLGQTAKALSGLSVRSGGGFDRLASQITNLSQGFESLKRISNLGQIGKDMSSLGKGLSSLRAPSSSTIENITRLAKSLNSFQKVSIPKGIGAEMQALGAGMASIKTPNVAAIQRIPALIKELSKAGNAKIGTAVAADLATLGAAFAAFRAPSASSGPRIIALLASLKGARINPNIAQGLGALGSAFSNFRSPSAAAATNIQRLIQVLGTGNVGAVNAMATALSRLNNLNTGGIRVPAAPRAPRPAGGAGGAGGGAGGIAAHTSALRGLENQLSLTYHAASLLRTALGSLTLGEAVHSIVDTGNQFLGLQLSMDAVGSSAQEAGQHMDFIRQVANATGADLASIIPEYQGFAVAMRSSGNSMAETQKVFQNLETLFSVRHISNQDRSNALRDIREMISMGSVRSQQLERGLATHIPDINSAIMEAMKKKNGGEPVDLHDALRNNKIDVDILLEALNILGQKVGTQLPEALKHSQAQLNIFGNSLTNFRDGVFKGGFDSGLAAMIRTLGEALDKMGMEDAAKKVGAAFQDVFKWLAVLGAEAIQHIDTIMKLAFALGALALAAGVFKLLMIPVSFVKGLWEAGAATAAFVKAAPGVFVSVVKFSAGFMLGAVAALAFGAAIAGVMEIGGMLSDMLSGWINDKFPSLARAIQDFREHTLLGQGVKKIGNILGFESPEDQMAGAPDPKPMAEKWSEHIRDTFAGTLGKIDIGGMVSGATDPSKIGSMFKGLGASLLPKEIQDNIKKMTDLMDQYGQHAASAGDHAANALRDEQAEWKKLHGMTKEQMDLLDKLNPAAKAARDLKKELHDLQETVGRSRKEGESPLSQKQADSLAYIAKYNALDKIDPFAAQVRSLTDELGIMKLTGDAREEEQKFLSMKTALLKQHVDLTTEQAASLRGLIKAQMQAEKGGADGFSQWANSTKEFKTAVNDNIKSSLDGIADNLADLVVKGKADFAGLAQSILKEFASTAIKSIMSDMIKGSGLSGALGGLFGAVDVNAAQKNGQGIVDKAMSAMTQTTQTALMEVTASVVNINGGMGANLGSPAGANLSTTAFGSPNTTSISGVDGGALGGVTAAQKLAATAQGTPGLPTGSSGLTGFGLGGAVDTSASGSGMAAAMAATGAAVAGGVVMDKNGNYHIPGVPDLTVGRSGSGGVGDLTPKYVGNIGGMDSMKAFDLQPPMLGGASGLGDIARSAATTANTLPSLGLTGAKPNASSFSDIQQLGGLQNIGKQMSDVRGLVFHHTGGGGTPEGVVNTLNQRGLGVQYVMGRDGQVYQAAPDFAKESHIQPANNGSGLSNNNAIGIEMIAKNNNDLTMAQKLSGQNFIKEMQQKYPNIGNNVYGHGEVNIGHKDPMEGMGVVNMYRQQQALRSQAVGGGDGQQAINQATEATAASFQAKMQPAVQSVGQNFEGTLQTATQGIGKDMTASIGGASSGMSELASSVTSLGGAAASSTGPLGSLISTLAQGAMSAGGGAGNLLGGLFKEGGLSGSPVSSGRMSASSWHGAPHYAEGTENTSGGIPAILHDNEAVIPLSRGRSIPVEMRGGGDNSLDNRGGDSHHFHFHGIKDADSFRKSRGQIATDMAAMHRRAASQG